MLRYSALCLLLLVDARLLSGSHAFQNAAAFGGVPLKPPTSKARNVRGRFAANFRSSSRRSDDGSESTRSMGWSLFGGSLTEGDSSSDVAKGTSSGTDDDDDDQPSERGAATAATNTINERLMAELREAEDTEKFGSKKGKMSPLDGYGRARKTDAERQAAIAEARDLNGVNPWVSIAGSFFALGVAYALWTATGKLGAFFAAHPPETEVYFVQRSAQVFRNVVMGMISLASGFFGVTGLGIFGMGVRVAYGVLTGELDPTPIKSRSAASTKESVNFGKMMDLMMNKKPGRRGGGKR